MKQFLACGSLEYKLPSFTYKVLTTSQASYLYDLISVQPPCITPSSSVITISRPTKSSSLKITNRFFRYAAPYLWNQLPESFCEPHPQFRMTTSFHLCLTVSLPWSCKISPFLSVTTFTIYHSSLSLQTQTHLFHKSLPP